MLNRKIITLWRAKPIKIIYTPVQNYFTENAKNSIFVYNWKSEKPQVPKQV